MFDSRLQQIKLELNTLALQNDINHDQMIKYLSCFELRPKKLNTLMTPDRQKNQKGSQPKNRHMQKKRLLKAPDTKQNYLGEEFLGEGTDKLVSQNQEYFNNIYELLQNSIIDLNRPASIIMENILELVVTKKTYKIRQNFRELALNILGIQDLTFYAYHENGRVQSHEFLSNFITEILQSDIKYQIFEKIIRSASEQFHIIEITDNNEFMKLFDINANKIENGSYFGTTLRWNLGQKEEALIVCIMIKTLEKRQTQSVYSLLIPKLLVKIIQICLIQTSEATESSISKLYSKKMLDILEIIIINCQNRLRKSLCQLANLPKQNYFNITNLIRIILNQKSKEKYHNEQLQFMIKSLSQKFEETQYRSIEQIRMYKKYVNSSSQIVLEFNKTGMLTFMSANSENSILKMVNQMWEPEKSILFEIFKGNQKFEQNYKKALRGNRLDRQFEIARDISARILTHRNKIYKFQIIFEDSEGSSTSYLQSKDSETKYKARRKRETMSNKTLKNIQEQHPGVSREGWIDLFLKNNQKTRNNKSVEKKKHNTYNENQTIISLRYRQTSFSVPINQFQLDVSKIEMDNPDANILNFEEDDLEPCAAVILNSLEYFQTFAKQKSKLSNFLVDLHDQYELHSNPFHNFRHGINVMHTCYILSNLSSNSEILSPKDIFTIIFSGLCHDVGHTGFTNTFQIASRSKKALIYNDKSPLENFHASTTFQLLRKQENNFLYGLQLQEFDSFRKNVIENILFTDIREHFSLLSKFSQKIDSKKKLTQEDSQLLSCMIVHSSDFGGSIKSFDICKQWSSRVNKQFSNQYEKQGQLGIPQTPFMKNLSDLSVMSKAECGFLKVIVYPLYQALDKMYLTESVIHKFKKNIQQNIKEWQYIHISETNLKKEKQQLTEENIKP